MNLTISASSASELKTKIIDMAGLFSATESITQVDSKPKLFSDKKIAVDIQAKSEEDVSPKEEKAEEKKPVEKKKTKTKAKAKKAKEEKGATKESAAAALKEVMAKFDLEKAKEILGQFGATRMSDLEDSKFQEFEDACSAALISE